MNTSSDNLKIQYERALRLALSEIENTISELDNFDYKSSPNVLLGEVLFNLLKIHYKVEGIIEDSTVGKA